MSNRNWNADRPHLLKAVRDLNTIGKRFNHDDIISQINSDNSHALHIVPDHKSFTDKSVQRTRKAVGTELDRTNKASHARVYLSDGKNRNTAADRRRSDIDVAGLKLNVQPEIISLSSYIDVKGKSKGDGTLDRNEPCNKIYVKYDGNLHNKDVPPTQLALSGVNPASPSDWKQAALLAKPGSRGFDAILLEGNHDRFSIMYSATKKHGSRSLQRKLEKLLPHMKVDNTVRRELGYNRARGDGKPSIRMTQEMLKMTPVLSIGLTPKTLKQLRNAQS